MNVVCCVNRSWNVKIIDRLLSIEAGKAWKIRRVFLPSDVPPPPWRVPFQPIDPVELERWADIITAEAPGVILCYGWSWMIPARIREIAPCLVLHPSPLPKYRGGSPIQNQILDGVTKSAVSIFIASERLDAGDILAQEAISFEGYLQVIVDRITDVGTRVTIDILDGMVEGRVSGVPQEDSQATVYRRRHPAMSEITLDEIKTCSAEYLYNKIRCLQEPYPEAFIVCGDGKKLYVTAAHLER